MIFCELYQAGAVSTLAMHPFFYLATHVSTQPLIHLLSRPFINLATHSFTKLPIPPRSYPFLHVATHSSTQLPIPPRSYPFLHVATHSSTQLPIPLRSYPFLYVATHSSTQLYPFLQVAAHSSTQLPILLRSYPFLQVAYHVCSYQLVTHISLSCKDKGMAGSVNNLVRTQDRSFLRMAVAWSGGGSQTSTRQICHRCRNLSDAKPATFIHVYTISIVTYKFT